MWANIVKNTPIKTVEEAPKPIRYYIDHTEIVRDGDRTLLEQDMTDALLHVKEQASQTFNYLLESVNTGSLLDLFKEYYNIPSLIETHREYIRDTTAEPNDMESKEESVDEDSVIETDNDDDFYY